MLVLVRPETVAITARTDGQSPDGAFVGEVERYAAAYRLEIEHFFDVYKMLEPDKNTITKGWEGAEAAYAEIELGRRRFAEAGGH